MWNVKKTIVKDARIEKFQILENDQLLTFKKVIDLWISNADFRVFYSGILTSSPFQSFFWEHPPLTKDDIDNDYEFVLVRSSQLHLTQAERQDFEEHFQGDELVVAFPNLGKNAQLIVPTPDRKDEIYNHFGNFLKHASAEQIHDFWKLVGECFEQSLTDQKRWLSTAGLGVFWLHVRIDQRPKYYKYGQYC